MIKSRRIRWEGHIENVVRKGVHIRFWWESQIERDREEGLDVGASIILKWILKESEWCGVD
jgi:hypothetical protein